MTDATTTSPKPKRRHRAPQGMGVFVSDGADAEPPTDPLWINDAELIRRLGVPYRVARAALQELDRNRASGFPHKDPLWGGRRYWPAVKSYFDRMYAPRRVTNGGL